MSKIINFPDPDGSHKSLIDKKFVHHAMELNDRIQNIIDNVDDEALRDELTHIQRQTVGMVEAYRDTKHLQMAQAEAFNASMMEALRQIDMVRDERDELLSIIQQLEDYAGSGA